MSRKASWVFGVVTASLAAGVVILAFFFALSDHPLRAVTALGIGMVSLGVLRAAWPGSPWFGARGRFSDGLVYTLVGVFLLWLSPWTSSLPPT